MQHQKKEYEGVQYLAYANKKPTVCVCACVYHQYYTAE